MLHVLSVIHADIWPCVETITDNGVIHHCLLGLLCNHQLLLGNYYTSCVHKVRGDYYVESKLKHPIHLDMLYLSDIN